MGSRTYGKTTYQIKLNFRKDIIMRMNLEFFFKCIFLLEQFVKVFSSWTARLYRHLITLFESRLAEMDSFIIEPTFVNFYYCFASDTTSNI
jgi:hypothetical protein